MPERVVSGSRLIILTSWKVTAMDPTSPGHGSGGTLPLPSSEGTGPARVSPEIAGQPVQPDARPDSLPASPSGSFSSVQPVIGNGLKDAEQVTLDQNSPITIAKQKLTGAVPAEHVPAAVKAMAQPRSFAELGFKAAQQTAFIAKGADLELALALFERGYSPAEIFNMVEMLDSAYARSLLALGYSKVQFDAWQLALDDLAGAESDEHDGDRDRMNLARAHAYKDLGYSAAEVTSLVKARGDLDFARLLAERGFSPSESIAFLKAGGTRAAADGCQKLGLAPAAVVDFMRSRAELQFTTAELEDFNAIINETDGEDEIDPRELLVLAHEFQAIGYKPAEAMSFVRANGSTELAKFLAGQWFMPQQAIEFAKCGGDLALATTLLTTLAFTRKEMMEFMAAGGMEAEARSSVSGVPPSEKIAFARQIQVLAKCMKDELPPARPRAELLGMIEDSVSETCPPQRAIGALCLIFAGYEEEQAADIILKTKLDMGKELVEFFRLGIPINDATLPKLRPEPDAVQTIQGSGKFNTVSVGPYVNADGQVARAVHKPLRAPGPGGRISSGAANLGIDRENQRIAERNLGVSNVENMLQAKATAEGVTLPRVYPDTSLALGGEPPVLGVVMSFAEGVTGHVLTAEQLRNAEFCRSAVWAGLTDAGIGQGDRHSTNYHAHFRTRNNFLGFTAFDNDMVLGSNVHPDDLVYDATHPTRHSYRGVRLPPVIDTAMLAVIRAVTDADIDRATKDVPGAATAMKARWAIIKAHAEALNAKLGGVIGVDEWGSARVQTLLDDPATSYVGRERASLARRQARATPAAGQPAVGQSVGQPDVVKDGKGAIL